MSPSNYVIQMKSCYMHFKAIPMYFCKYVLFICSLWIISNQTTETFTIADGSGLTTGTYTLE